MFPSLPPLLLGAFAGETIWVGLPASIAFVVIAAWAWQFQRAQNRQAAERAEYSRRLAEEQEKTCEALLEKAAISRESQAKSEMLATLSREIRAHLNGIIGSADLMLENSPKPQDREHLTTLRTSAESLHQSLNDVVDFSRIETGHIEIAHAIFDLRQPMVEVVEHVAPLALLKELELVLIIAPDVPLLVTGDVARVRQVLLNLMSNAVRSTTAGRVVLRVEPGSGPGGSSPPASRWLRFSVSDTGPGIPEATQGTLFDPSVPSGTGSPRQFGGSGLELAVSKRLVELMGGRISAHNLPETGAEFSATLPLAAEPVPQTPTAVAPPGLHVVVLAELAASRVALSAMLTRLGVEHDVTDTVPKAAEFLRDAIEADAREPVLLVDSAFIQNRRELADTLKADKVLQATRVVLMTRTPDMVPAGAHELPITAVVRKPLLSPELLLEACKRPAGTAAARLSSSRAPFGAAPESAPAARRGPLVLVVDDDEISRYVSAQLLTRLGCVVDLAVSGGEALERAGRTAFDLIFMDCQMPEMDGFATTERIRSAAGDKAPPIVALTANTSAADRERCFSVGMCDFVGKPVRKSDLLRVLKRWIHERGGVAK